MQTSFMKRAVAGAVAAAAMLLAGAAQAALQERDLNGDTVTDAFYDTDLNITWLRNANVNGTMDWNTAVAWADGFSFGGYSDWRLPVSDTCQKYNCTGGEMGHLWYVELDNSAGDTTPNTGNFRNMKLYAYWSGTATDATNAWHINIDQGDQDVAGKESLLYAMAVRTGDVVAVPEPQSYALMLPGLSALVLARRRRPDGGFGASGQRPLDDSGSVARPTTT